MRGVLTLGVAFIEGCPHIRSGHYRGVSSRQGWGHTVCAMKSLVPFQVTEINRCLLFTA